MFELPETDNAQHIADWIELELALERESISKAWLTSVIESSDGESNENFLSDIWRILSDRAGRYREPRFSVEKDLITHIESAEPIDPYVACLLFSLYSTNKQRNDPKLFERLIAISIAKYLCGESYVFGWPVLDNIPANIESRIREVCSKTKEKFAEAPQAKYKDRGVDVISWKPFHENPENRSNQLVVLSQCAVGGNWRSKTGELPLDAWKQYIHWANQPIRAFAVPAVIHDDLWHDISTEAGLLFDRIRIINYVPQPFPDTPLLNEIRDWIELEKENATLQ
jgi:hypothetical protein